MENYKIDVNQLTTQSVELTPVLVDELDNLIYKTTVNLFDKAIEETYKPYNCRHSFDPLPPQKLYKTIKNVRIIDVNVIVPNKVVEVMFGDGDKQKAVCNESDVFSLETAISICLTKHIVGGSSVYNKMVKDGLKVYERRITKEVAEKVEKERIEEKRAKKAEKLRKRRKRKEIEEMEKQINIQKEAYIRAMKEVRKWDD